MERANLFTKPKEVQDLILKNIRAGFAGNFFVPLLYALITDIVFADPKLYFFFILLTCTNASVHGLLATEHSRKVFDQKLWSSIYLATLSLEAISFVLPPIYFAHTLGVWSPEFVASVVIWVISTEAFARYCHAWFESLVLASVFFTAPLVLALPFVGLKGIIVSSIFMFYYAHLMSGAYIAYLQHKKLIKTKLLANAERKRVFNLINVLPEIVVQFDENLEIIIANKKYKIWSVGEDNFEQAISRQLLVFIKDFVAASRQEFDAELRDCFNGSAGWFHISLRKTYSYDLKKNLFILVALDITDKKENEKELEQQKLSGIASSRLASLGEMAAGIAHEINNPLAIISMNSKSISRAIDKKNMEPEKFKKNLAKIDSTVERISHIIIAMKNLSRQDEEKSLSEHKIGGIIEDAVSLCAENYKSSGVEFINNNEAEDLSVCCHYQQVGQIIVNLLNNSFDAVMDTDNPNKAIELKTFKDGDYILIQVLDNGPGIEDESKLFQPFHTTKPVGKGTGLGLSISQKIAQNSGGNLVYKRVVGRTCFELTLPISKIEKAVS